MGSRSRGKGQQGDFGFRRTGIRGGFGVRLVAVLLAGCASAVVLEDAQATHKCPHNTHYNTRYVWEFVPAEAHTHFTAQSGRLTVPTSYRLRPGWGLGPVLYHGAGVSRTGFNYNNGVVSETFRFENAGSQDNILCRQFERCPSDDGGSTYRDIPRRNGMPASELVCGRIQCAESVAAIPGVGSVCLPADIHADARACAAGGWTISFDHGPNAYCDIPLRDHSAGRNLPRCRLNASGGKYECRDLFGIRDGRADIPRRHASHAGGSRYAAACSAGQVPQTLWNGAGVQPCAGGVKECLTRAGQCHASATCEDPDWQTTNTAAELCNCNPVYHSVIPGLFLYTPEGDGTADGTGCNPPVRNDCSEKGWTVLHDAYCEIYNLVLTAASGTRPFPRCLFAAEHTPSLAQFGFPRCQDVFGDPLVFPRRGNPGDPGTREQFPYHYCEDGKKINLARDACVADCPAGQQIADSFPLHCEMCGAGTYSPTAGQQCRTCNGEVNAARTACGLAMIDECEARAGECHAEAACHDPDERSANTAEELCNCDTAGYSGDGVSCTPDVTVNLNAGAGGSLSGKWTGSPAVEDGDFVARGALVTFAADPDDGYYVSSWAGCVQTADNVGNKNDRAAKECALQLFANATVGANFAEVRWAVDLNPGSKGALSAGWSGDSDLRSGETVRHGATVTFTANPDDGYYVSGWSVAGCARPTVHIGGHADGGDKTCATAAESDLTVAASFADINECATNNGGCGVNSCRNDPPGSFTCAACPDGQSATSNNGINSGTCFPDGALTAANNCEASGWIARPAFGGTCEISLERFGLVSGSGTSCDFDPSSVATNICATIFGDPPVFPQKTTGGPGTSGNPIKYCGTAGHKLNSAGDACVSDCPPGEESDGASLRPQCRPCGAGTYNPTAGGSCVACGGGNFVNAERTACAAARTVRLVAAVNGTLSASWSGDGDLRSGGTVPDGTTVTFTATPDAGYYVSDWSGCARTDANTGGDGDGEAKTCAAAADGGDLAAGAVFADRDECGSGTHTCGSNAQCQNTAGKFSCECDSGYRRGAGGTDQNPLCENINECGAGTNPCGSNARCVDTAGLYFCQCDSGYALGPGGTDTNPLCANVNECDAGTDNCHGDARCEDTAGSFSCRCNDGFTGNGILTSEPGGTGTGCTPDPNNECSPNPCGANTVCRDPNPVATNTGDYVCSCGDGFSGTTTTGVPTTCTDVDECVLGTDTCGDAEKCRNTAGSFACDRLPEVWIVAPAGEMFRAVPESGCEIRKWTEKCEGRDAALSDCTPDGEGMVTVGVIFDCGN